LSEQYEDMKQRLHSKDEEDKVLQAENQDLKLHFRKLEAVTNRTHEETLNSMAVANVLSFMDWPGIRMRTLMI